MSNPSSKTFRAFAWFAISLALNGQASFPKQAFHQRSEITPQNSILPQNNTLHECEAYPLEQSTWLHFGWDDYLRNYPNGSKLTTEAYAASKGAVNFKCGIGENPNVGQLCSPVKAPDWYILYATQNLNVYLNTLHQVTGEAISITQSTMASVWNDLFPAIIGHSDLQVIGHSDLQAVFGLSVVAASIQAVGVLFLLFIPDAALLFKVAPFAFMSAINMEFATIMCLSLLPIIVGRVILSTHDTSGPLQSQEFRAVALNFVL